MRRREREGGKAKGQGYGRVGRRRGAFFLTSQVLEGATRASPATLTPTHGAACRGLPADRHPTDTDTDPHPGSDGLPPLCPADRPAMAPPPPPPPPPHAPEHSGGEAGHGSSAPPSIEATRRASVQPGGRKRMKSGAERRRGGGGGQRGFSGRGTNKTEEGLGGVAEERTVRVSDNDDFRHPEPLAQRRRHPRLEAQAVGVLPFRELGAVRALAQPGWMVVDGWLIGLG